MIGVPAHLGPLSWTCWTKEIGCWAPASRWTSRSSRRMCASHLHLSSSWKQCVGARNKIWERSCVMLLTPDLHQDSLSMGGCIGASSSWLSRSSAMAPPPASKETLICPAASRERTSSRDRVYLKPQGGQIVSWFNSPLFRKFKSLSVTIAITSVSGKCSLLENVVNKEV